jgi:hypothetical protein
MVLFDSVTLPSRSIDRLALFRPELETSSLASVIFTEFRLALTFVDSAFTLSSSSEYGA